MAFYYLSFCDRDLPKGQQFLGATVVEAEDEWSILAVLNALGRNPGGEIAVVELAIASPDTLPPDARKYLDGFVSREQALADPHLTIEELDGDDAAAPEHICVGCNKKE